jgi:hypothetical protein
LEPIKSSEGTTTQSSSIHTKETPLVPTTQSAGTSNMFLKSKFDQKFLGSRKNDFFNQKLAAGIVRSFNLSIDYSIKIFFRYVQIELHEKLILLKTPPYNKQSEAYTMLIQPCCYTYTGLEKVHIEI